MKNANDLARTITLLEGKKISLPIGQVKEVLRVLCGLIRKKPGTVLPILLRLAFK